MQHTVKLSNCVIKNTYTSFSELITNFNILFKGVLCYITKTNDQIKFFTILTKGSEVKTLNSCAINDQAHLILPSEPFTRTDELPLGQNGNGFKTDKNTNRTEIKRERNGNGTVLPVPLYGRQMETFF